MDLKDIEEKINLPISQGSQTPAQIALAKRLESLKMRIKQKTMKDEGKI